MPALTKKAILVLGMHRSGTSALAGVIGRLGVALPSDLLPPIPGNNELGFYESRDLYEAHENLLEANALAWDEPLAFNLDDFSSASIVEFKSRALAVLSRDFSQAEMFVLKDPRVCRILPLWLDILSEFGALPLVVIPIRDPLEVSASLKVRDTMLPAKAQLLWLRHTLQAEKDSRNITRSFLTYQNLLADWRKSLRKIAADLSIRWPQFTKNNELKIEHFISPHLQHQKSDNVALFASNNVSRWVKRTYQSMLDLTITKNNIEIIRELDEIYHEVSEADSAFGLVIAEQANKLTEIKTKYQLSCAQISSLSMQLSKTKEDITNQVEAANNLSRELEISKSIIQESQKILCSEKERANTKQIQLTKALHDAEERARFSQQELSMAVHKCEQEAKSAHELAKALRNAKEKLQLEDKEKSELLVIFQETRVCSEQQRISNEILSRDLAEAHRQQKTLEQSFSWRITKPIRTAHLYGARTLKAFYWLLTLQLPWRIRHLQDYHLIRTSGLFDPAYYCGQMIRMPIFDRDPIWHYLATGANQGHDPNPYFDTSFYLQMYPDIADAKINPLVHFILQGKMERRDPGPHFNTQDYLQRYSDVDASNMNPLAHYLSQGKIEGREISPSSLSSKKSDVGASVAPDSISEVPYLSVLASNTRLIAFYLPQFHPIPENDDWWGTGFTEWRNVTRATPQYRGHQQPLLPSELGFYDLRVPEVREDQVRLAQHYGIHGFCYYFYWFNGKRLLERPLEDILETGLPDFPFCICWANENWTRRWDGLESEVLIGQSHSLSSDYDFIKDVIPILKDKRYIKVDGKPLLIVYRPELFNNPKETAAVWRDACIQAGIGDIHLCSVIFRQHDPRDFGFDAAIEFPPHYFPAPEITQNIKAGDEGNFQGKILDYIAGARHLIDHPPTPFYPLYRGVMPAWDNTPRRGSAAVIHHGSSPKAYASWLRSAINYRQPGLEKRDNLVFINAWNEWAEGAILEPSITHGRSYLQATLWALTNQDTVDFEKNDSLVVDTYGYANAALHPVQGPNTLSTKPTPSSIDQRLSRWVLKNPKLATLAFRFPRISMAALSVVRALQPSPNKDGATESSSDRIITTTIDCRWQYRPGFDIKSSAQPLLFVSHDAARAGSQLVLLEIIRRILEAGKFEPYLLLLQGGELEGEFTCTANLINIEEYQIIIGSRESAEKAVFEHVAQLKPIMAICNTVVTSSMVARLNQAKIPVLSLIHELATSIDASYGKDSVLTITQNARHIIVVSHFALNSLLHNYGLPLSKFSIVHPCVLPHKKEGLLDAEKARAFRKRFSIDESQLIVLGCGQLHPRKGPDIFIQVARQHYTQHCDSSTVFVWVGGGEPWYERWCQHDIHSSGLANKVILTGHRHITADAFAAAHVFLLTSREDPFPLVSLEAMAASVPVVAFEGAGGAPEGIGADAGIVVPYLDVVQMETALSRLIYNPDFYYLCAQAGQNKANTTYSFDKYYAGLAGVIKREFDTEI